MKDKVSDFKIDDRQEIKKLARNLPDTAPVEDDNDIKKLIRKLNDHLLLDKNKQHARYTFSNQQQELGESIINYTARSDKRQEKGKESWKKMSRKQPRQTLTQAANQIANTFNRQHDMIVLHWAKKLRSGRTQDSVFIKIGDTDAHVEPDSRACVNTMDEYQFGALKHRSKEIRELQCRSKQRNIEDSPNWYGSYIQV